MISGAYQPIGLDDEGKVKSQLTPTCIQTSNVSRLLHNVLEIHISGAKLRIDLEGNSPTADVDVNA